MDGVVHLDPLHVFTAVQKRICTYILLFCQSRIHDIILYRVLSTFHYFPPPLPADFLIGSQDRFRLPPKTAEAPPLYGPHASDGLAT
jgi:hypothetical protein